MSAIVFLNPAKIDFDGNIDFSPLEELGTFTRYDLSDNDDILEKIKGQEVVITKELPVGKDVIDRFPSSVRVICEAGTGYNNIDVDAARHKGIAVCNVPNYSTEAVAQLAVTFMLNLSCSLVQQQIAVRRGDFRNFTEQLRVPHFELYGKTLGIIGGGAIGGHVTKLALALGMRVLVNQRTPKVSHDPLVSYVSLEELLQKSDFVSIHCPLTPQTKHMINKETLALMKPTAYVVNTSRGAIIDEAALIEALRNGTIAGAGLDVQEQEPPETGNPLFAMDNVIMTPHIGWKRLETRQRLIQLTADNIAAFLKGSPRNIVT